MEHITSLSLRLAAPSKVVLTYGFVPQLAPFLQGALMEHIDKEYAERLHGLPFNPYSQCCTFDSENNQIIWKIKALTNEATQHLIKPMQETDFVFLKKLDADLPIVAKTIDETPLRSITDLIAKDPTQKSSIDFVTPTAFKSKGSYVFMPSVRLIFQNLLMRYGQIYGADKDIDPETMRYIDEHVSIASYSIRSKYFGNVTQENKKLPAFVGSISIYAKGPQHLIGLVRMLVKFAEYSGVGIKTSMGMGGVQCK